MMRPFKSNLKQIMDEFVAFRKMEGKWNDGYQRTLQCFDNLCFSKFADCTLPTQEMIDIWCQLRTTETSNSGRGRMFPVLDLAQYTNDRQLTSIRIPNIPKLKKCTHIPHFITDEEAKRLFDVCDRIVPGPKCPKDVGYAWKMAVPVFFRMMFSTGMRPKEILNLKREWVDLDTGAVNVKVSKGNGHHYVALHPSMISLLKRYDQAVQKRFPDRIYFFHNPVNQKYTVHWVDNNFRKFWDIANPGIYAIAYDFRHTYAIRNINRMSNGLEIRKEMAYLSKSMGHWSIESTKRYFALTPIMNTILEEKESQDLGEILSGIKL